VEILTLSKVIDLDILRPEPRVVKIGGKEIDVSFIPCGITFDLDAIVQELVKIKPEKIKSDPKEMRRAFDLGIKLCSVFCQHKYPEMDEQWFLDNASSTQVNGFTSAIQTALYESYAGVTAHSKN
jgi:hypothetical protein